MAFDELDDTMTLGKGVFVTLEGIDGCGKSTQAGLVAAALEELGLRVRRLREPGGTSISEKVRAILLDPANAEMAPEAELLLYEASRAQLVRQVIEPSVRLGEAVVCDRFFDSTFAYQATARGLDEQLVLAANDLGSCGVRPDVTLVFDLDPEVAWARATRGGADRLEAEGVAFQQRVRQGYLRMAELAPERVRIVDAQGTPEEVFARALAELSQAIPALSNLDAAAFMQRQADLERAMAAITAEADGEATNA